MSHEVLGPKADASVQRIGSTFPEFRRIISQNAYAETVDKIDGTTRDNKIFSMKVQSGDPSSATVSIYDRHTGTSYMAKTLKTEFTFTPLLRNLRFWMGVARNSYNIDAKLGHNYSFEYNAGVREGAEDDKRDSDKVATRVSAKENEDGSYSITRMVHNAKLSNPNNGAPDLEFFVEAGIADQQLMFTLGLGLIKKYKGESVVGSIEKFFVPNEDGIYRGKPVLGLITEEMPNNLSIISREEQERIRLGRINMGRLNRLMPSEFTAEQVDRMMANALDGRIFTAGVWSPLSIPELRVKSKKQI